MGFNVIVDTREKNPWEFDDKLIDEVISHKLDTGDYSIEGLEDVLFIERKSSLMEFYNNITQKRFWAELERTEDFKYKFLIAEFKASQIDMFPQGLKLPKRVISQLRVTPQYLYSCIARISVDYGINVMFADNRFSGASLCTYIMRKVNQCQQQQS